MKSNFPSLTQWAAINSISFFLAVQVFFFSSTVALGLTFLDQSYPPRDVSFLAGALLLLTVEILLAGSLIGLLMGGYQCEVLKQIGIKRKTWLLATVAGAVGGYGFFVYSQFVRVYVTGIQTLFNPLILQCIGAATVVCIGQWYVFSQHRLQNSLWIVTTVVALSGANFATYMLRNHVFWSMAVTLIMGLAYSMLLYRALAQMRMQRRMILEAEDRVARR